MGNLLDGTSVCAALSAHKEPVFSSGGSTRAGNSSVNSIAALRNKLEGGDFSSFRQKFERRNDLAGKIREKGWRLE